MTIAGTTLPGGVSLGAATATGTIADDETLTASVTAASPTVAEGSVAAFIVTLTGGTSTADVTVTCIMGGTVTSGADYTAPSQPLTIPAGQSSGTITVPTTSDGVLDPGETLIMILTGASTAAGAARHDASPATTTITETGTVTVAWASGVTVAEGAAAAFTAELSGAVSSPVTVGWSTSDGTATAGSDYTAASGTLTFPADSTQARTVTVTTLDDALAEGDETFTVTLSGSNLPDGVSLGAAAATGTIADDEAAPTGVTLSVSPASVPEGAGAAPVEVTAALDGAPRDEPTVVTVSVAGDTAGADDFAPVPSFDVTIAAAQASGRARFTLTPADDAVVEGPETLAVTGTTAAPGMTVTGASLTIADDDEPNAPPVFDRARYAFELPENTPGRPTPAPLGTVSARDPDGDRLTYSLAGGDRGRFVVSPANGALSYVGGGEDFEAGPPRFELRVTAGGRRARGGRAGGGAGGGRAGGAGGRGRSGGDGRRRAGSHRRAGERPRPGRGRAADLGRGAAPRTGPRRWCRAGCAMPPSRTGTARTASPTRCRTRAA